MYNIRVFVASSILLPHIIILIRFILEYGSVLWNPSTVVASIIRLRESREYFNVQMAFTNNIPHPLHGYTPIRLPPLILLHYRHVQIIFPFLLTYFKNKTNCPFLRFVIHFRVSTHHIYSHIPLITTYKTNVSLFYLMFYAHEEPFSCPIAKSDQINFFFFKQIF